MDPEYGRAYRRLYEAHWWWRAREAAIVDVLRTLAPAGGWSRILDIGCGDGLFFDRLSEFSSSIEGIEPSAALVTDDPGRRGAIFIRPFDATFQPAAPYGLIVMLDVLEHLAHPAEALSHALSLLEPSGTMLITVPAFMSVWTSHDVMNEHVTRYTKSSFRALAAEVGFRIHRAKYFFHWTFPIRYIQHLVESVAQPKSSVLPSIPPRPINAILYHLSRAEWGLNLSFGTSLLVIGGR
ncbi:MAG TPA: class I SAM-dependent methyltransferase [Gemmatimonadaceae bacterium]|nr:class I SAM-dependent methyltransferase [Gemmatimonadaceae bacterium]